MTGMRVMTYNVHSLRDSSTAVARVIRAADADVVCIQEAPRFWFWRVRCWWLALRCQRRWVVGGPSSGACLVLARRDMEVVERRSLTFTSDPSLHQRGAAVATVAIPAGRLVVAATHLDLMPQPRLRHAHELRATLAAVVPAGATVIIAGDVNETPAGQAWTALADGARDAFAEAGVDEGKTFPAGQPVKRIDGVFVSGPAVVTGTKVLDSPDVRRASDHRPVVVDIQWLTK